MKEFQSFRTREGIILLFLIALCLWVAGKIIFWGPREFKKTAAQRALFSLGAQLAEATPQRLQGLSESSPGIPSFFSKDTSKKYRFPASVSAQKVGSYGLGAAGRIGKDPWGQAYQFVVLEGLEGRQHFLVWSAGKNKKFETIPEDFLKAPLSLPLNKNLAVRGDDLGYAFETH